MFNRVADVQRIERKQKLEDYRQELEQTHDKRIKERKFNEAQEKQYELMQALNKKQESDYINNQTLQSKRNMQNILAQEYEQSIRLKKMRDQNEVDRVCFK